jgi:hypothetical protein
MMVVAAGLHAERALDSLAADAHSLSYPYRRNPNLAVGAAEAEMLRHALLVGGVVRDAEPQRVTLRFTRELLRWTDSRPDAGARVDANACHQDLVCGLTVISISK